MKTGLSTRTIPYLTILLPNEIAGLFKSSLSNLPSKLAPLYSMAVGKGIRQNRHTRWLHQQSHAIFQRLLRPSQRQRSQNMPIADTHDITRLWRHLRNALSTGPLGHCFADGATDLCYELVQAASNLLGGPMRPHICISAACTRSKVGIR